MIKKKKNRKKNIGKVLVNDECLNINTLTKIYVSLIFFR